ncbi:MAG: aspartate kinase [Fimbriiglobus sp.]
MAVVVQKFGGSSVANSEKILAAAKRAIMAKEAGHKVVVVVSAVGKTTDTLIALAEDISKTPPAREMDMLLATGEQVSIALMAIAIHQLEAKAISFTGPQLGIVTDSSHLKAWIKSIDTSKLIEALESGYIAVVAGFQGVDEKYDITTLGRGGSDTTAVAVAAAIKLAGYDVECEIYTDVNGVYTTDPRIVKKAIKLDRISYDEMLEMASMGAGVMHSRSIEFAKKFDVPLKVRHSQIDDEGTWIVGEEDWMREIPVCGAALATNEARLVLDGVPDKPGVSRTIFEALAKRSIPVDMITQNVGSAGKASIGFTVINSDLKKTKETLDPIVAELGAKLTVTERVSKVSVVGAGMRYVAGVAEKMFAALAAQGVNIKMITTGDIKISVLIDEDVPPTDDEEFDANTKKSHLEAKRAVRGRLALEAVHDAFQLQIPRQKSEDSTGFRPRAKPAVVTADKDRATAVSRLDGMEDILVSGVHLNADQCRVTIFDLPDWPGNCSTVFTAIAKAGILVDMIVQNLTAPGRAELSFTVPRSSLDLALEQTRLVVAKIDPTCRVEGDANIAVLFVLGVGMRSHTGVAQKMFGALAAANINISMINTSEVCLGVVIEKPRGEEALVALKTAFELK